MELKMEEIKFIEKVSGALKAIFLMRDMMGDKSFDETCSKLNESVTNDLVEYENLKEFKEFIMESIFSIDEPTVKVPTCGTKKFDQWVHKTTMEALKELKDDPFYTTVDLVRFLVSKTGSKYLYFLILMVK